MNMNRILCQQGRFDRVWLILLIALAPLQSVRGEESDSDPQLSQPIGWASAAGGTTGGIGGPVISVDNAEDLARVVKGDAAAIVQVVGQITLDKAIRVGSNKTILGVGSDAVLTRGGLSIRNAHNVVVRNLTIKGVEGSGDAIGIDGSHHVWIDHCDLSNCQDGLLDVKHGADFITVSWNHFHHHHKTSLVGHSDKPDAQRLDEGHLRVTYHHNFFDGTLSRHPRVRYGETVHIFNNYFLRNGHGVNSVMDAGVLVEGNYFEEVKYPVEIDFGASPRPGRAVERSNIYDRCEFPPKTQGNVNEVRDSYPYRLTPAEKVPDLVRKDAGVGKVEIRTR